MVLMPDRFLRHGLDVELALETDSPFVVHCQVQEFRQMLLLAFHVGVEQGLVAFAAAPESVAFATQFVRDFHRLLDLTGGVGEHVGVATGARAMYEARVGKEVRGAPQQLDAGTLLFFF